MAILINPYSNPARWKQAFEPLLPGEELRWYPDVGDPADIDYLVAWLMPRAELASFTNLKAILGLGAGTEQWQKPGMPDVPVVRLADPAMAAEMASYALSYVVRHQRGFAEVERAQADRSWKTPDRPQTADYRVGILGYGTIGSRIGQAFSDLGYPVNGWARSDRSIDGVAIFSGLEQLDDFLANSDAVINVLPSTEATTGLLDRARFSRFAEGALFVNVGRGSVVASDADLVAAIDDGPLSAAVLDVTNPEPLPPDSPLWDHPAVTVTPHLSGITQVHSAATVVAGNIAKLRAGQSVEPILDRSRGY